MAGYRHPSKKRPNRPLKPMQKTTREQRRLAYLQIRLDEAGDDPSARLVAAMAYLRGVVKRADSATATRIAGQFEAAVIETGTRLFADRREDDQHHDLEGI